MELTDKSLIIFDLDGTLVDSVPDLAVAVNRMLEALGRHGFDEETIRYWVGNGAQVLVRRALSGSAEIDPGLDEGLFERALKIFLDFYGRHLCVYTRTYDHVPDTLHALKERGYTLAVVTNKPMAFVPPLLEGVHLAGYFSFLLGGDSLERKKPDPLPLEHLCKALDTPIGSAVMVGDSKNDILAAKACGMEAIAVTYGYNYGEDIGVYHPDIVLDDFGALLKYL